LSVSWGLTLRRQALRTRALLTMAILTMWLYLLRQHLLRLLRLVTGVGVLSPTQSCTHLRNVGYLVRGGGRGRGRVKEAWD
jgi:hypothetical protein